MSLFNRITHSRESASPPSSHDVFISPGKKSRVSLAWSFRCQLHVTGTCIQLFSLSQLHLRQQLWSGLEDCRGQWRGMFNLTTKNEAGKISGKATNPNRVNLVGISRAGLLLSWEPTHWTRQSVALPRLLFKTGFTSKTRGPWTNARS